jgi:hypothetical protein
MYGCSSSGTALPEDISSIINQSDYIFQGTITNDQEIALPINLENATVRNVKVDNVISSGNGHESFTGKNVQVVFDRKDTHEIGQSYLFYTKTWLFGKTLTVVANHMKTSFTIKEVESEVNTYRELQEDKKMQERLKRAELVIIGKVETVREFNSDKQRVKLSEHLPMWKESTIEVLETLKGKNTSKTIRVLYASSQDVQWYSSPKLSEGQRRIYILNRKEEFQETEGNFVLSKADESYPLSQETKIKQLLKN